jgi:glycosyltransferase involved in cell wall biosynthesis
MISSEYPPGCGGSGIFTSEISERLVKRGHIVTVLTRGRHIETNRYMENGVNIFRIYCPQVYPFHVRIHKFFLNRSFKNLESQFDLVHFHTPLIPLQDTKLIKVATIHGTVSGGINAMDFSDVRSVFTKIFSPEFIHSEKQIIRTADLLLPISDDCLNDVMALYGILLQGKPMSVINNGVDTSFFSPLKIERERSNTIKLLYVGRLSSQKGLKDLVFAVDHLLSSKKINIECIIVGDGPLKYNLQRLIADLKLRRYFRFTGHISSKARLRSFYQDSDIFLLPSYYEGCPTVLLEAMSCGLPCIATNVGGIPEVIQNGINGYTISANSPQELSDRILQLVLDENLRRTFGINARSFIIKHYDWNIIISNLEMVYKKMLKGLSNYY